MTNTEEALELARSHELAGYRETAKLIRTLVAEQESASRKLFESDFRLRSIRQLHAKEQFGDCVEDGDLFPCRTIQILDALITVT